ncbi:TIGR04283 family arsenosugar biosynthesis glycosyltransferase [Planctomycetota bacterium]
MSNRSVSVVIPALNEAANIQAAVESAAVSGAFEVIVVDGGSTDQTRAIAESISEKVKVLVSSPGRATQQNAGANAASGDILLFLHADCRLATNCIHEIKCVVTDRKNAGGYGAFRQVINDPAWIYRWIEWGNGLRVRWMAMPYGDQGIWVRRELFEAVGGFPSVMLMEDIKLSEQLRVHGRPKLLDGPVHVGARRWQQFGPIRQTLRNWKLVVRHKMGVPPSELIKSYPQHDA